MLKNKRNTLLVWNGLAMLAFILMNANIAMATNYECTTEHVLFWKDGQLVPQNDREFNGAHAILRFNDEKGDLWLANDKESPFNPMPFRVLQTMPDQGPHRGLLAIFDGSDDKWLAGSSLRISAPNKKTGLVFLFDLSNEPAIYTGKCHIYKGIIWPVLHDE